MPENFFSAVFIFIKDTPSSIARTDAAAAFNTLCLPGRFNSNFDTEPCLLDKENSDEKNLVL